jgi:hypothetical protein
MSQTQLFLFFVLDKELGKNLNQDKAQNKNGIAPNELQDPEQRLNPPQGFQAVFRILHFFSVTFKTPNKNVFPNFFLLITF